MWEISERPVLLSSIASGNQFWFTNDDVMDLPEVQSGENHCVIPLMSREIDIRAIRDWLCDNVDHFEVFGFYVVPSGEDNIYSFCPFAAKFLFNNPDDRFLFALRWL